MDRLELANAANASLVNNTATNATLGNGTTAAAHSAAPFPSDLPTLLRFLYANRHMFLMEARLVALTLGIIYVGAHGSLQRPHSAAPRKEPEEVDDDDDEDDHDKGAASADSSAKRRRQRRRRRRRAAKAAAAAAAADEKKEGLQASDAIMLPFAAAITLVGLYYVIQYLQDPALLNRILRVYTSTMAVASLGKLLGDSLHVVASFVFPTLWVDTRDPTPTLYRVEPLQRCQFRQPLSGAAAAAAPAGSNGSDATVWIRDPTRTSPFPDHLTAWMPRWLSSQSASSSSSSSSSSYPVAWTIRRLVKEHWSVRVALHGIGATEADGLTLLGAIGILLAAVLAGLHHFVGVWPDALNNLLGLGFCYVGLLLVSCTSFGIGSLVLGGLFVYDIVMVFYTPFMVTVATSIDAPIKLVAHSGGRSSLLGLGDIVVPGIFICLCLRYDLYCFYAGKIKDVPTELETTAKTETKPETEQDAAVTTTTSTTITTTTMATRAVKAPYVNPQGRWGDRFWTRGGARRPATPAAAAAATTAITPGLQAARFPKPYFRTAMVAYVVGLLLAMGVMLATGRGQPALLYLVPSLVLATWGRALVRGTHELRALWAYTEDGALDVADVVVAVGPDGQPVEETKKKEESKEGKNKEKEDDHTKEKKATDDDDDHDDDEGYDVFLLAIRAPAEADMAETDY
ncbi:signal peptide peptidase [Niveomyces insectorum RCEF 264]|uniref:Signal peptide peptidase n=1 Tax=Niveomyces insectorum RCEF 264 TaxID=1081102 RepID=A0A167VAV6_9HYPO|nr:signal peptide peptidase [Niveomyces insectorum RCEF 264]